MTNEKKYNVCALGEILIDYTPQGLSEMGYPVYIQNPGGAPMNMAAAVRKLSADKNVSAAFIGKVGNDAQGRFLINAVKNSGIDISGIAVDDERETTLAFVSLRDDGNREFTFYRTHQADINLNTDDIENDTDIIAGSKVFHFGSLSMTHEPARSATLKALEIAEKSGCIISFDPNFRAALQTKELFIKSVDAIINSVDIMKMSEEEIRLYTGLYDISECADALMKRAEKLKILAVTLGADGSYIKCRDAEFENPVYNENIKTIDTTGAGDIFWGSFVSAFLSSGADFGDTEKIKASFRFASISAGLSTAKKGGAPSIPEREEIIGLM